MRMSKQRQQVTKGLGRDLGAWESTHELVWVDLKSKDDKRKTQEILGGCFSEGNFYF